MTEHGFKVGDIVEIVGWGWADGENAAPLSEEEESYNGMRGPVTRVFPDDTIFVDIGVPGILLNDLICYPNELKKVEGN